MIAFEPHMVFFLVALPLLGSAMSLMAKAFLSPRPARFLEYTAAFIGLALPWLVLIYSSGEMLNGGSYTGVIGGWSARVGILFRFDGLAWMVNLMGFFVAGAAWLYSQGNGPKGPGFTSVFLIQTAALAATAMTADIFNLFVCLEVMGIASYVLIASSEKPGAFLASFSYLMVSATAMIFFLIGIFGLYRLTGSLSYEGIADGLAGMPENGGMSAIVSLSLIIGAVAIRVAIMPVYGWLPDAHALAPHSISAVLSGVLIKTPLFALSRVVLLLPAGAAAAGLMGYAGALTALVAVLVALSQKDAKRLLAYHSVSQIGYVVSAWGAALYAGTSTRAGAALMAAAFLHALYHALFKGLLFLSVGTVTDAAGERNVYRLRGGAAILRAKGEKIPITLLSFITAALAITAIPPMNGYVSKAALSYALKGRWEYYLLFAAGIGTMASFIKLSRIFFGSPDPSILHNSGKEESAQNTRFSSSLPASFSQLFLTLAIIGTGIAGPFIYRVILRMFSSGVTSGSRYNASFFSSLNLYTWASMRNTLIILVSGAVLYFLAATSPGKRILTLIRERQRGFHGLLTSFTLGTLTLAIWMLLGA